MKEEHPTVMIRTISILLIWTIGDCHALLCQIIPYQYLVSAESGLNQYTEYDREISMVISSSLSDHVKKKEEQLIENHETQTKLKLALLTHQGDSINIAYFLHELDQSKKDLQDSLALLAPLKLQANQMEFMSSNKVFLPVRNTLDSKMFFSMDGTGSDARLMSHNSFSYNTQSERLALYSELFSDYFGPLRFGFGALLTSGRDEAEERETLPMDIQNNQDALQRLLNGGGNSVMSLAYPLIQYRNHSWSRGLRILAVPKYALDIPALGSTADSYAANADLGIEASAHWAGNTQNIALFFQTRIGYVMGNSAFKTAINSKKNFVVSQFNFGIAFRNTIKLSYTVHNINNNDIRGDLPGFISFSLIPQF